MSDKNKTDEANISTRLSLASHFKGTDNQYYEKLHHTLPKMRKNQLSIHGADIQISNPDKIIVTAFIRSTLGKAIHLKPSTIVLLDINSDPFAKMKVAFTDFGTLPPRTSRPWVIEFPKESMEQYDRDKLERWSLAFENSTEHKVDFSDMDSKTISEFSKAKLSKIDREAPLDKDELSLMGLSAKHDKTGNLITTLLIRNGLNRNLDIKQLPLKFYDATGELSAKGTFKLDQLTVLANTSKPVTFVFPASRLLKTQMDLSKWSIIHNE